MSATLRMGSQKARAKSLAFTLELDCMALAKQLGGMAVHELANVRGNVEAWAELGAVGKLEELSDRVGALARRARSGGTVTMDQIRGL